MEDIRQSADSAGPIVLDLQRARHGPAFTAFGLRGSGIRTACDPYLNIDHAWMSAPTLYHITPRRGESSPPGLLWRESAKQHGIDWIRDDAQLEKMLGAVIFCAPPKPP